MSAVRKPSVLVCVTGQYDCRRLIEAGFDLATATDCELHVFCVHTPKNDLSHFSEEIEYLYRTAAGLGADMTVMFSPNAPRCTADFARKINAMHLITGVPDERPNGFVLTLQEFLPGMQITMVTKDGERLHYSFDTTKRAFA